MRGIVVDLDYEDTANVGKNGDMVDKKGAPDDGADFVVGDASRSNPMDSDVWPVLEGAKSSDWAING